MQYPPELSLATTSMRNFLVQTIQLEPKSVRTCRAGDRLRIRLPENTLCDLSTFAIRCAAIGIRGTGAASQCVFPRDTMSLIQQIDVSVNHTVVDSIRDYNHMHKMIDDMTANNYFSKNGVTRHNQNLISNRTAPAAIGVRTVSGTRGVAADAPIPSANTDTFSPQQNAWEFSFQDWHGFLGQNRWIDTRITGPIDILIWFAGPEVMMNGTSADNAVTTFLLSNLRAHVNVAEIEDGVYANFVSQRLQAGGIPINYKRYLTYRPEQLTGTGSVQFHVNTKSLDAAYCVLLHPNPGRTAPQTTVASANDFISEPTQTQEGAYFRRYIFAPTDPDAGVVKSAYCMLQSQQFPAFRADPADMYYLAQLAFNHTGNKFDSCSAPTYELDYGTWMNDEAFFAYRWSYSPDLAIESGINSQGLELYGSFEYEVGLPVGASATSAEFVVSPLVILETTATLLVQADRNIMLLQ